METIADLVAAGREREGVAIDAPDRSAPYSYRELCTNTWKAGNLLGHYTHPGGHVAVVVGPKDSAAGADQSGGDGPAAPPDRAGTIDSADPLLAALGGTLVGATVTLTPGGPVAADALVRPAGEHWREQYPAEPGCAVLAYGGPPEPSSVEGFEAALWSENPIEPPEHVEATTPALRTADGTHTHGDLLDGAAEAVDRHRLDGSSRVALAGDLRESDVLVGVLASLSVGATLVVGESTAGAGDDVTVVPEGSEGRKD
jgi:hypothetical protein